MSKSGFEINPIGYTGFFCSSTNPATGDCFWNCIIREIHDDTFLVEIEDGRVDWIKKEDFTPLAIIWKDDPRHSINRIKEDV